MNPRTRAIIGSDEVMEKYGVPPHLLCDLQALTGDSAVSHVLCTALLRRLCCTVLYYTVLYYTILDCTTLYCTVLYCTVLYCTVLLRGRAGCSVIVYVAM